MMDNGEVWVYGDIEGVGVWGYRGRGGVWGSRWDCG